MRFRPFRRVRPAVPRPPLAAVPRVRAFVFVPFILGLLLPFAASCGGGTGPGSELAGRWTAERFVVATPGAATVDLVAGGSRIRLDVAADSRTAGELFVPAALAASAGLDAGTDFTAPLGGVVFEGPVRNAVQFDFDADVLLDGLVFRSGGGRLVADTVTADGVRIGLTLRRQ
jgi:hypothetical protein